MSAWAKPGVKCVCVSDEPFPESQPLSPGSWSPTKGKIYTIKELDHHPRGLALVLEECPTNWQCFLIKRFRPIITRTQEQDMAIFRPMLNSIPVGEDA